MLKSNFNLLKNKAHQKINRFRCWKISRDQCNSFLDNNKTYITIFHDYEGEYARIGLRNLSRYSVNQILNIEKKYHVSATYNIVGKLFGDEPEMIEKIIKNGHDISSHTYDHKVMTDLDTLAIEQDIIKCRKIFETWSLKLRGYRSPQSKWNFKLMQCLVKNGIKWSAEDEVLRTPYIISQHKAQEVVRFPIIMDDWDYITKKITPEAMYQKLVDTTNYIINNGCYGAIGFHPWVQGEKKERLDVFDRFVKYLVKNEQVCIVTFDHIYKNYMTFLKQQSK